MASASATTTDISDEGRRWAVVGVCLTKVFTPPSKYMLKYENINNNPVCKYPPAYDYAVKDPLSLAKLFVQPFMAAFTSFDQTMDMSAVLTVMIEANPFVSSGVVADAKKFRSDIRNQWAHIKLSPADEKALCDDLNGWKDKGIVK